ncbi:MAG: hypothetical protein KA987_05925 [Saprospiraceae bacterium]|jgi:hypothetical protein|nr:hypothetical protein [Saprospiraceae bacterium]
MLGKLLGFYLIRQGCLDILHRSMDATTYGYYNINGLSLSTNRDSLMPLEKGRSPDIFVKEIMDEL